MSETNFLGDFISDAFSSAVKASFYETRIERVVHYLETEPAPDNRFVIKLLRGALDECQRKAGT